jgi:ankyrin repeat protein
MVEDDFYDFEQNQDFINNQEINFAIPQIIINKSFLKGYKFVIKLIDVKGLPSLNYFEKYYLDIEIDKKIHRIKSCPSRERIWDLRDFYAPTTVKITIYRKDFYMKCLIKIICTKTMSLIDFLSTAENYNYNKNNKDIICREKKNYIRLESNIFKEKTSNKFLENIKSASNFILSNRMIESENYVDIIIQARLIPLQSCVSLSPLNHLQSFNDNNGIFSYPLEFDKNLEQSDFHLMAAFGSSYLVQNILLSLSRKQFITAALSLQNSQGYTVFDVALLNSNYYVIKILLKRAGNICFLGSIASRSCAIHNAVKGGCPKCLKLLLTFLKTHANAIEWEAQFSDMIEWRDDKSDTPLLLACSIDSKTNPQILEIVQLLIDIGGADVGSYNCITYYTPLMEASKCGSFAIVSLLISYHKCNRDIVVSIMTLAGKYLDHYHAFESILYSNQLNLLICRPHNVDKDGLNAIMLATGGGFANVVEILLSIGMTHMEINKDGENLFHIAARNGFSSVCEILLASEEKKWLEYRNFVKGKSIEKMQYQSKTLLIRNLNGKTPIDLARQNNHIELLNKLTDASELMYCTIEDNNKSIISTSNNNINDIIDDDKYDDFADDTAYKYAFVSQNKPFVVNYYSSLAKMNIEIDDENNNDNNTEKIVN